MESVPTLADAALVTIRLTVVSGALGLLAGALSAAAQLSGVTALRILSRIYVSLMRGTPLFVQLLVVSFGLPMLGVSADPFLAAALAIGLNSGAYVTEILRAGVLAVPAGQIEAAAAVGLSPVRIWTRILLPQAFAISLPALAAELTIVLKSTPLASVVAVTEMTYSGVLIQSRAFSAIEVFVPIAVGYILIAQAILRGARHLEGRLARARA
nr:amino acid ABC transporter permease [Chthonobacter albigriseus]